MKKMIIKSLSVVLAVILTLTAPLSGFMGLELPEWLDASIDVNAVEIEDTTEPDDSNKTEWEDWDDTEVHTHIVGEAIVENEVPPTCDMDGYYDSVVYCTDCGEELSRDTVVIPAIGHTFVVSDTTAPSCTEPGIVTYTCELCDYSYEEETDGSSGHVPMTITVPATCEVNGMMYDICEVCGEVVGETTIIPATGHNYQSEVTSPTCTTSGYTTYTCSCGDQYVADEIAAIGHNYVSYKTEPSCTEEGYTIYQCLNCGDQYTGSYVDALGHTPGEAEKENIIEPTCATEGSYDNVVYCDVCWEEISRETVTVPPYGHNYWAEVTEATCTDGGYTIYYCNDCGDQYIADEVPATGHTASEVVVEYEYAPTCTEDGSYDNVVYCSVCWEELSRETVTVPATGHTASDIYVENEYWPTCTEDGSYDNVVYCSVCWEEISRATEIIPATGHTASDVVVENEYGATCEWDGSYDNVVYCVVCGTELSRETVTVPATGHDYWSEVTEATCTESGYTTYECYVCGDSYVSDYVEALGHTYVDGVCSVCGYSDFPSGTCGDNLTWIFNTTTGTLTISGTGAMYDYEYDFESDSYNRPWESYEDSIKNVVIENGVITIGEYAFALCENLTSVTIPNSVTTIGEYAFGACYSLTSVTIPDNITTISEGIFYECTSLTTVTIPDSVTTICEGAFAYCSNLTSVTIPDSVTAIGDHAFIYCESLENVSIGNSVTTIGFGAFGGCTSLTSVTIPDSVTSIGDAAFAICTSLTKITVDSNNPNYASNEDGVLFNKDYTVLIQYPNGNARTSYTIPDSVVTVGYGAFGDSINLVSVTISDSVTTIGEFAFTECYSLASITIPDSVTIIDDYAFEYCDSLTSITIPDSVTTIGNYAFYGCDSLTDVYYSGTEAQWNEITIGSYNDPLINANIHFEDDEHEHSYTSVVTEPTCTEQGYTTYTCTYCGEEYISDYTEPYEHNYVENMIDPSCETEGYTDHVCMYCGDSYKDNYIAAWGHEYISQSYAPTCTQEGYTQYVCSYCLDSYRTDFIDALGHDFGDWTVEKEPTILSDGKETHTCKTCGFKETNILDKIVVDVENNEKYGVVNLTVVHAQTLKPIKNANIFVSTENDGENTFATDENGTVSIVLPVGEQLISAYYSGCITRNVQITVNPGINDIPAIGLSDKPVYEAHLTSKEMTLEEIEEAGIDTSDPDNQNLYKYELKLDFEAEIDMESIIYYMNPEGEVIYPEPGPDPEPSKPTLHYHVVSGANVHSWCKYQFVEVGESVSLSYVPTRDNKDYVFDGWYEDASFTKKITSVNIDSNNTIVYGRWKYVGSGKEPVKINLPSGGGGGIRIETENDVMTVYPINEYFCLIVHGEITWLKEMFDVEMLVVNNSQTDTLEDLTATLNIPDGLSLADMVSGEQTLSQDIPDIQGGESKSVHWYIRGDKEGSYDLNAQLTGKVMPFNETIDDNYLLENKINVYSGSAMHLHFEMPDAAFYAEDYPIRITLENVSDKTLYNVNHAIQIEQGMKVYYSDGTTKERTEISDWFSEGVEKFYPGDKLIFEVSVNIFFESEVIKHRLQQYIDVVDQIERLYKAYETVDLVGDVIGILKGDIGAIIEALDPSADLVGTLVSELRSLYSLFTSSGDSIFEVANIFFNSYAYHSLKEMTENPEAWANEHNESELRALINTIRAIKKECYNVDTKPLRKFDIFDSIRTAISAIPVRFVLESLVMTVSDDSNVYIPWSYSTYAAGPRYFGVSSVSKYCSSILAAGLGEIYDEFVPWYVRLIPGIDDPVNKKEAIAYIQATEDEIARIKAKDATGEVTFKAWVESGNATITTDNKDAEYGDDGSVTFTGDGTISVTPQDGEDGVIYIEDSEGNIYEYVIEVVEEHECVAGDMEIMIAPTPEYDGFAVKRCVTCKEVMDIINLSYADCCEVHNFTEWIVETEATETDYGIKTRYCVDCGATEYDYIPSLAHEHSFDDWQEVVPATCEIAGTEKRVCTVCDSEETREIAALGHTEELIPAVAPTCESAGNTEGIICSRCSIVLVYSEPIPALGHTSGEPVVENSTAANCGQSGSYDEVVYCTVCYVELSRVTKTVDALPHSYDNYVVTIAPTCTSSGVMTYTCTVCGDSYVEEMTAPGHDYTSVVTDPTCIDKGYTTYTCTRCGKSYTDDEVPALGHTEGKTVVENSTAATCGKSGSYDEVVYCIVCYAELSRVTKTVDKIPHSYDNGVVTIAPTCTMEGVMTYTCTVCGDSYVEEMTAPGHDYTSVVTAPTCKKGGYTTYTCSCCNNTYIGDETPATGHNFVDNICTACGKVLSTETPVIMVDSKLGITGNEITVAISLKNNPGITSMLLNVNYDTTKLQLVAVDDCGKLGAAVHGNALGNPYTLSWANDTATENYTYNGEIVVLTFNVLDDAELGETSITVTYDYDNFDIIDKNMDPVEFETVEGIINIINVTIGDVNEDGKVNTLDRVILTRYIAKWAEYPEGSINMIAADVNGDGKVNTLDRVILTRYIAKWEGYETLPYKS